MLNLFARAPISRVTDPIGSWLVRRGLNPNAVTVFGTAGSVAGATWLIPAGHLTAAALTITVFVLFDLADGAMARARGGGSAFGGVLDSTCDRIADGGLFAALAWWCLGLGDDRMLGVAALVCLVSGQVISYVKARAEAAGLNADGGLVERAERLILALLGTLLQGLGAPHALDLALWVLAVLSLVTVLQRMVAVYRSAQAGSGR